MIKKIFVFALVILMHPGILHGAMSSTKFYIYSDSIGVNGGSYSTSASYGVADTIGGSPVGTISSASFSLQGGFQNMERGNVSIAISDNSIVLPELSVFDVKSASTNVVVTSEAASGYTLSVSNVSGSAQQAVADGVVTAGQNEYGVAVSGNGAAFGDDRGISGGRILASASDPIYDDTTTLTFKASYNSSLPQQSFNQTITLLVTAN